jgi:hypothetical protein
MVAYSIGGRRQVVERVGRPMGRPIHRGSPILVTSPGPRNGLVGFGDGFPEQAGPGHDIGWLGWEMDGVYRPSRGVGTRWDARRGLRDVSLAEGFRAALFAVPSCVLIGGILGLIIAAALDFVLAASSGARVSPPYVAELGALLGLLLSPWAAWKLMLAERRWAGEDSSRGPGIR